MPVSNVALTEDKPARWKICGLKFPTLFERASSQWWKPSFDSKILEGQFADTSFPQIRQRYRMALGYVLLASISWLIYFLWFRYKNWAYYVTVCSLATLFCISSIGVSFLSYYRRRRSQISLFTAFVLCALSLMTFASYADDRETGITVVAVFATSVEAIIVIYTLLPIPLHISFVCCCLHTFAYEILYWLVVPWQRRWPAAVRILMHFCTHLIGTHIYVMNEARSRSTFLKVGQSLLVRQDLQIEKHLKEKMIHSVMPPKVADWLMTTHPEGEEKQDGFQEDENIRFVGKSRSKMSGNLSCSPRPSAHNFLPVFRPFNMHRMEDVSILYADIVGFTKMSSNKSAERLVDLLNDLFGRFDRLCTINGCEKITTLGDCYYCVSGCPEPEPEHAKCCVEMGFSMLTAIKQFDEEKGEQVDMRVGVHTGTVLCGIVGTRRFKFDVWSNDVSLANTMESTGKPGTVHVSEITLKYLKNDYDFSDGDYVAGMKTYFVTGHKESSNDRNSKSYPITIKTSLPNLKTNNLEEVEMHRHHRNEEEDEATEMSDMMIQGRSTHVSLNTLNSRKDSGIRSDRSSLPDFYDVNQLSGVTIGDSLVHRVSGYYTSSLPSINPNTSTRVTNSDGCAIGSFSVDPNLNLNESLAQVGNLRKQSDLQIIKCIQKDICRMDRLVKYPISPLTLFFLDKDTEKEYRKKAYACHKEKMKASVDSQHFNLYYDMFVAWTTFAFTSISSLILFDTSIAWIVTFCLVFALNSFVTALCLHFKFPLRKSSTIGCALDSCFRFVCTTWYPRHFFGTLVILAPFLSVLANYDSFGDSRQIREENAFYFCQLSFVGIVHVCNMTRLNWWAKLASVATCVVILLVLFGVDASSPCFGDVATHPVPASFNSSLPDLGDFFCTDKFYHEFTMCLAILLVLVLLLNREFEISHRYTFHGSQLALKDKAKVQAMKNQAELLLHNIIPKHVADQLKITSKYSENHTKVGVLFASITNFNDMYDESYEGGKEYLRILNELVGDYDELLSQKRFSNVEKIKTIGSTFMAASGLNPAIRNCNKHANQHLFELMDFAIAMQKVINNFNSNLLEFNFTLRIGYNFGDVTAGVIGTTKLYYDIWGDAVNIASRMDSTGIVGQIQVSEFCVPVLESVFDFKYRDRIFVKGKNEMNVYLLDGRKDVDYKNADPGLSN